MDTLPITTPRQAGIYVRQAREAQGIARATLAKKAGVSERLLASLELGDATGIRLERMQKIREQIEYGQFSCTWDNVVCGLCHVDAFLFQKV